MVTSRGATAGCRVIARCLSNPTLHFLSRLSSMQRSNFSICINKKATTRGAAVDQQFRRNDLNIKNRSAISRAFSRARSSSSKPPYLYGDRVIFNKSSSEQQQVPYDWSGPPPLRVPSLTPQARCPIIYSGDEVHKLVVMDLIGVEIDTEQQLFDNYVKTFARAIGSDDDEEEAKRRIYLHDCSTS